MCDQQDHNGMVCGASFEIEGNLKNHISTVHSGKQFNCAICSTGQSSFPNLPALQAHIKINHPPTCSECGFEFASREILSSHFEAKHDNIPVDQRRRYPCLHPGCGRAFTLKSNLNKHVRAAHEESKSFVCGMVDPKTLMHVQDWDGSNACGRALSTKYNLIGHIRNFHLGLGPLKRSDKERQESLSADAALMRLTGIGYEEGREVECLIQGCVHRFTRDYDLQRHLQSHHGLMASDIDEVARLTDSLRHKTYQHDLSSLDCTENMNLKHSTESQSADFNDHFSVLENHAAVGGVFWFGGESFEYSTASTGWSETLRQESAESDHQSLEHVRPDDFLTTLDPRLI